MANYRHRGPDSETFVNGYTPKSEEPVRAHPYDIMYYYNSCDVSELVWFSPSPTRRGVIHIGERQYIQDENVAPVTDEGKRLLVEYGR